MSLLRAAKSSAAMRRTRWPAREIEKSVEALPSGGREPVPLTRAPTPSSVAPTGRNCGAATK
jgi:hypothetical protein